jgi:Co/Zn/Cd efflux system component
MLRVLHAIVMILAVVAGHLPAMWRQAPNPVRYRNTLGAIVGSLVLIIVGIFIIAMAG